MNWYKHYMGDYTRDTAHLTITQHGVYRLMLDHYYSTEKPLPTDLSTVFRVVRAITPEEQKAVSSILSQFFIMESDGYHNIRADEELEKYSSQVEHNRSVGKLGGRPKNPEITQVVTETEPGNNPSGSEIETRNITRTVTRKEPNPDTRYQIPDTTGQNPDIRGHKKLNGQNKFDLFWSAYPKKVKKKGTLTIWQRRKLDDQADKIIEDVKTRIEKHDAWKDKQYIPDPSTYLNGERWNDEIIGAPTQKKKIVIPDRNDHKGIEKLGQQLGIYPKGAEDYYAYRQRLIEAQNETA